jgi:glycosyltransferase involved in cell wall biosynthesis
MRLEILLYILYLAVGPGFWILVAFAMASSRRRMNLLEKSTQPIPQPPPKVTIIIPAKDEGERIRQCLASVLAQDYSQFDVLAVDDRSSDVTGQVMDEMAAADPRMKVLHIAELPIGWTGKNHALFRAASCAQGQWLLFIDSDVILQPAALSTTLRVAISRRYDMLSLILRQETRGIWESALVPIASAAIGSAYMIGLSNSESNNYYFGNGQYMLFNRKIYDQIGGHEAVKTQFNEDMALTRLMKQLRLRPRIAWGADLGSVRMYDSLPNIMKGWSRIFFGCGSGSPWRSLAVMLFILIGGYSAFIAAAWGVYRVGHPVGLCNGIPWLAAAAIHWTLMTVQIGMTFRWMGGRAIYAAASFITGLFILAILAHAVWMCITGRVHWRGTSYSHPIETVNPEKAVK